MVDTDPLKLSSTILLANSTNSQHYYLNIFMTMLLSSLLTGIINYVCKEIHYKRIKKYVVEILETYNITKKEYKIILSSRTIYSKYMVRCNDITEQKLAVLYYIKKNINRYSDLYTVKQDYTKKGLSLYGAELANTKTELFYSISQSKEIELKREGGDYIKVRSVEDTVDNNKEDKNVSNIKINDLILTTNRSLFYLKEFIEECIQLKLEEDQDDTNQYIYTYTGEDDERRLTYQKELFIPYSCFNTLVGKHIKNIEKNIDFFISKEGKEWHKSRGVPYQLTHLYYGEPGTGKSIIASAIVHKYKLHIVKIKLSDIKSNREFCRVFKNREYDGKRIDYDKILYLFDEVDIEFENILKRNQLNKVAKQTPQPIILNKDEENLTIQVKAKDQLTVGTILEEINGINQMYGRKMVFITNNYDKLLDIHNGALTRPGRIDLTLEFKKLAKKDAIEMIRLFFPINIDERIIEHLEDYKYTPATLSNICKICSNIDELVEYLSCN
jgi:transcriptional regulator CtsR